MTKELPKDRQIYISARLWHEVYPKVNLTPFIYVLHERIDLSRYGSAIEKFYFTFIVVRPGDDINLPYVDYDPQAKKVDLAIRIPYQEVLEASERETIELMEKAYLEGTAQLDDLNLENFDAARFRSDVEAIFSEDEWYHIPEAA